MKSANKASNLIFLLLIFIMIAGMGIAILLKPQKSFSERENRSLQVFPSLSFSSALSGEFSRCLSSFYSDQLPLRDELGYLYSLTELSMGKQECNGVFVCERSVFVQLPSKSAGDGEILKNNLLSAEDLQKRTDTVCFWVPRSSDVFAEQMPESLRELSSETVGASNCKLTERMLNELSRAEDPSEYYYRTDHHWATKGAYKAYTLLASELGYEPYGESFFQTETVATDFLGTSFSRTALPKNVAVPDSIVLYRYDRDRYVTVTDRAGKNAPLEMYDFSALDGYDKYRVFLGGNHAHISVELPPVAQEKRDKLLVVKDSFANSLIPFLALHFDLEVIDPRYATASQMRELCEQEELEKILVLCSLDTLSTERTVGRFLDIID